MSENKTIALVTGASSGLGEQFCRQLAQRCDVIIAVAGMEGALVSVLGGLVDKPVLAVPSGIGYGANFGGVTTLLAMVNSCASGVAVLNIGNGFGAGFMAATICRQIDQRVKAALARSDRERQ